MGNAQTIADTITLTSDFKGFKFYCRGNELKAKDVFIQLENNEAAYDEFNASREAYFFGNLFGVLGSALIVFPFVQSMVSNDVNYGPAFAGVCFVGISIPIFRSYNKKTVSSIYMYNTGLKDANKDTGSSLSFGINNNGIGFSYSF